MKKRMVQMFGLALLLSACSGKTYQALIWKEKPVSIDGHRDDWNEYLRYFDKSSKMFYELDNDNQNLYFAISTRDQSSQQKIMQKGLTLGIDFAASKNYPIQVIFPYAEQQMGHPAKDSLARAQQPNLSAPGNRSQTPSKPFPGQSDPSGQSGPQPLRMAEPQRIFIKGFMPEVTDSILDVRNPYGISVSMQLADSTLFVEGQIPLKTFYKDEITAADTLNPVSFQILLSALDKPEQASSENSDRPAGPPSGGMQGEFGGPGGPGGGPGGMPPSGGGMGRPNGVAGGMSGSQKSSEESSQTKLDYNQKEINLTMRFTLKE